MSSISSPAGRRRSALRVPSHPVAHALLEAFGDGIVAPSANRFGRLSPTRAEHVRAELGDAVDLILDGGPTDVGVESTIVDLSGDRPVAAPSRRHHARATRGGPWRATGGAPRCFPARLWHIAEPLRANDTSRNRLTGPS